MTEKKEEQTIPHRSKIDDVFAFAGFRRLRKLERSEIRITQTKQDINKPMDPA